MRKIIILSLALLSTTVMSCAQSNHTIRQEVTKDNVYEKYQGSWELISINDQMEDYQISLILKQGESRIGGSTGCNSFSGQVVCNGDELVIQRVIATKRMCQPDRMAMERRILSVIQGSFNIERDNNHLILTSDNNTLVFQKAESKE